jgi:coenzyme F420-reducing hydrogenase alpha subunit
MDVKQYFRKIREVEAGIQEEFPMVISLETTDGGKAGRISEVSRFNAAKMIVESRAVIANEEQKQQFLDRQLAARRAAEQAELSKRVQVAIISESDLQGHTSSRKK